jgi:hypothetical protein
LGAKIRRFFDLSKSIRIFLLKVKLKPKMLAGSGIF